MGSTPSYCCWGKTSKNVAKLSKPKTRQDPPKSENFPKPPQLPIPPEFRNLVRNCIFFEPPLLVAKNRSARRSSGSNKVLWPWHRRSNNGIGVVDFWQESWNCPFLRGYEKMQICGNFEESWLNRILNSLGWQRNEFCFIHFYPTSNFKKILVSTSVHQSTCSFIHHTTMLSSQAPADGIFECWLPYPPRSGTSAELERLDQMVTEPLKIRRRFGPKRKGSSSGYTLFLGASCLTLGV